MKALDKEQRRVLQLFWTQWTDEYLKNLPCMVPQFSDRGTINIGSVVLVRDDNLSRLQWPLGLITETYPSTDGKIRSVKVKTATSEIVRPVQKLHLLEMVRSGSEENEKFSHPQDYQQSCRSSLTPEDIGDEDQSESCSSSHSPAESDIQDQSKSCRSSLKPELIQKPAEIDSHNQTSDDSQLEVRSRRARRVRKPQRLDL